MRPLVTSIGPLASASATNIGLSQKSAAAQPIVLNGTLGSFTANNVCTSQSGSTATALLLNGTLAQSFPTDYLGVSVTTATVANVLSAFSAPQRIYITSAGSDLGITFAVTGLVLGSQGGWQTGPGFAVLKETITGANASTASSVNAYAYILSIVPSGNTASTVTVGTYGIATLDVPRRVIITSGGNDTGITFAITGTNWAGNTVTETLTGASGAAAQSVLDYKTVSYIKPSAAVATTVTVGTNGVGSTPWLSLDPYAFAQVALQVDVTGTVNYTVQQTLDDPNSPTNAVLPGSMTWFSHADPNLVGQTASIQGSYTYAPLFTRVLLNSGSGSLTYTAIQHAAVPF